MELIKGMNVGTGNRINDGPGLDEGPGVGTGDGPELDEVLGVGNGDESGSDKGLADCAGLHDRPSNRIST